MITLQHIHNSFFFELATYYQKDELKAIWRACYNFILELKPNQLITNPNQEINAQKLIKMNHAISRLKNHEPIQYITGKSWFCEQIFEVNKSVLIPRPETEELVYKICESIEEKALTILDIGTGSGCIAISIKNLKPKTNVVAIDISEDALNTASNNAVHILGKTSISFINRDVLNPDFPTVFISKFDIIVSNPPYITLEEKETLHQNVINFEPHLALFCGNDALLFYKAIATHAKQLLKPGGLLFFEIHENFGKEVEKILILENFKETIILKDLQGKTE